MVCDRLRRPAARTLIDTAVRFGERLCFEGPAEVVLPLVQDDKARRPIAHDGPALDTRTVLPSLSTYQHARIAEAKARDQKKLEPEAAAIRGQADLRLAEALSKRAGMPVFELLGGKAHDAVAVYDHQGGRTKEACLETLQKSLANGFRHVRIQFGDGGYGGGGFIPAGQGSRAEGGYQGPAFDEEQYVDAIPPVFEYLRAKAGFGPKLLHDVHSHMTGMNAVELCRRLQPVQMYFVEDVLPPEQIATWLSESNLRVVLDPEDLDALPA